MPQRWLETIERTPRVVFVVLVGAYLIFLAVTLWALKGNLREARSPRLRCYTAECAATHREPVGVLRSGVDVPGPRAVDHLAIRLSLKAFAVLFVLGAVAAAVLWGSVREATSAAPMPFALVAYLWWTLPLGLGSLGVWAVMSGADRRALNRLR
ncbi:hypothetical protein L0U85_00645 [Glycomyces sp. L485]|uniref:hypothetical protein n=1 Tax=Glycomyces sp. L485 TaxID=2909235 RepID=UPI001F4BCA65|nr:hypothetical protein [Glycomyces sp. L485]MCH7229377.1 hypothetical protein [Glycomyces sp. L485]